MIAAGILVSRTAFSASTFVSFGLNTLDLTNTLLTTESPRNNQRAVLNLRFNDELRPLSSDIEYETWSQWMRDHVSSLLDKDPSLTGPLIRLAFHDTSMAQPTSTIP